MRIPSLLAIVFALALGDVVAQENNPAPDTKLEGVWTVVKVARGGAPHAGGDSQPSRLSFEKDGGYRLSFRDTMVTAKGVLENSHEEAGKIRVSGRELDLLDKDGKVVRQSGVFKFEKGGLMIALGHGTERPKSFDAADAVEVLVLRSAKK